jgi:sodium transport system permease protein
MNVTLLARELLVGQARLGATLLVLGSTALYGCVTLSFAARFYDSERFLDPAAERDRRREKGRAAPSDDPPSAGQALTLFAVAFLLLWFIFIPWQKHSLVPAWSPASTWGCWGCRWRWPRGEPLVREHGGAAPAARRGGAGRGPHRQLGLGGGGHPQRVAGAGAEDVLEQMRKVLLPGADSRGLLASLLLVAATPALCEEVLFRGVVLRGLATRLTPVGAIVITGVLFGMFHLNVWKLLPTALLGIVLSWVAFESRHSGRR